MTTPLNLPANEPKIQIIDNHAITTSIDVAEFFEKRHDDVLKAIRNIIKKDSQWGLRNFAECEIIRDIPLQGEKAMPYFTMTRDGFVMLVMSFTGEKAFGFKIRYIEAFNAMEAQLSGNSEPLEIDAPSTKTDREPLTNLVNTFVSVAPVSYRDAWAMVKAHLKTSKAAAELTVSEVGRALIFVQEKIDLHTAKPIGFDYPDAQVGIITELALQGARRFSLTISLGQKHTKSTGLITKQFKADIYLFEEAAIEPRGLSYSVRSIV